MMSDSEAAEEMQDLAMADLHVADQMLYFTAKQFVLVTERDMITGQVEADQTIGNVRLDLVEAADRASAAYDRADKAGCFDGLDDEEGSEGSGEDGEGEGAS
jgi:hypothetical protein